MVENRDLLSACSMHRGTNYMKFSENYELALLI